MMRRAPVAALALAWAGCTTTIGPFVRDVQIHDKYLVVERCTIVKTGDTIDVGSCTSESHALPVTRSAAARRAELEAKKAPPPGLGRKQVGDGVRALRPAVRACGPRLQVSGKVKTRIAVAPSGHVIEVKVEHDSDLVRWCVGAAVHAARFAPAANGIRFAATFELGDTPPPSVSPPTTTGDGAAAGP